VTGSNQYTDSTSLFEKIKGIVFEWILLAATLLGILSLFVLLVYVTLDALAVFNPDQASWLTWELFTQSYSRHPEEAGLFPPLIGSILIITTMTLAVFPLGVGAAIYLEEYAQDLFRSTSATWPGYHRSSTGCSDWPYSSMRWNWNEDS